MKKITQNLTNLKAWQSTIFAFMFLFSLTINAQEVGQEYLGNPLLTLQKLRLKQVLMLLQVTFLEILTLVVGDLANRVLMLLLVVIMEIVILKTECLRCSKKMEKVEFSI